MTTPAGTGKRGRVQLSLPEHAHGGPGGHRRLPGHRAGRGRHPLVAITGTNLADATMVSFGGVAGMISSDSVHADHRQPPRPAKGTVDVMVTTPAAPRPRACSPTPLPPRRRRVRWSPGSPRPVGRPEAGPRSRSPGPAWPAPAKSASAARQGRSPLTPAGRITVKSPPGKGTVTVTVTTSGGRHVGRHRRVPVHLHGPGSQLRWPKTTGPAAASAGELGEAQQQAGTRGNPRNAEPARVGAVKPRVVEERLTLASISQSAAWLSSHDPTPRRRYRSVTRRFPMSAPPGRG